MGPGARHLPGTLTQASWPTGAVWEGTHIFTGQRMPHRSRTRACEFALHQRAQAGPVAPHPLGAVRCLIFSGREVC